MGRIIYRVERLSNAFEPYWRRDCKDLDEAEELYQRYLDRAYAELSDDRHVRLLKIEEIHGRA